MHTPTRIYGDTLFRLAPDRCPLRGGEVHQLTQRWQAPSRTQFVIGQSPPDWPAMRITEIDPETEIDDAAYEIRLTAEGIADGSSALILAHDEDEPSESWDTIRRRIYTLNPHASHLRPGGQIMATPITGVTGTASTEVLAKTAHGLTDGRLIDLTLGGSGFAGLTDGARYVVNRVDADSLRLLTTTGIYVSGAASTDQLSVLDVNYTAIAHGLTANEMVMFVSLEGGSGLATWTPYYVLYGTPTAFQLSATPGGTAINFTTDIPHSFGNGRTQLRRVATFTTDGTGATLTPVAVGYERMFITDLSRSKALGCIEAEALGLSGYYYVDVQMKGLNAVSGDTKQIVRRMQGSPEAVTIDPFASTSVTRRAFEGAANDLRRSASDTTTLLAGEVNFDLPAVSVSETCILTEPPPTWILGHGSRWTPNDPPDVSYLGVYSSSPSLNFPHGWKLNNLTSEQIPGQRLWLTTLQWVNQRYANP